MSNEMGALVRAYAWPSQAYWRYFELKVLRAVSMEHPILEIGCGDGWFSSLLFEKVEAAIDNNPKAIARAQASHLYERVWCQNACSLSETVGKFATVYANCVMEHVLGIEEVLPACWRILRARGQLVMTVPLQEMNRHLLLRSAAYARWRQKRLAHYNLLSCESWRELLRKAGFTSIECTPYLGADACRFWDMLDVAGCVGTTRYCFATALAWLLRTRRKQNHPPVEDTRYGVISRRLAGWLENHLSCNEDLSTPCAALIVADK